MSGPSGPRILDLNPEDAPETTFDRMLGAFSKRRKENQIEKQDTDALSDIYKKYQNEGRNIETALMDIQSRPGISPTARVNSANQLLELHKMNTEVQKKAKEELRKEDLEKQKVEIARAKAEKEADAKKDKDAADKAERERVQRSVRELYRGVLPDDEAERRSQFDSEATARSVVSQKSKPEKAAPKSEFQKTIEKKSAEQLIKLEEDIPKAEDALSNLDRIEEISNKYLKGISGYAKAFIGTESAKEMENLGFTAIEPIIKLFNPVGPIPVQKLKIIREEFQPKATDMQTTVAGKINALRRIGNQAVARAKERVRIIRQFEGNPPEEVIKTFDNESENLRDAIADQEIANLKMKDKKPDDLITGLYSTANGKPLKGIPKKEVEQMLKQGLVTYVKPN